jgi:penicillin-binding protein 1A
LSTNASHITSDETSSKKAPKKQLKTWLKWTFIVGMWLVFLSPYLIVRGALWWATDEAKLPSFEELENPQSNIASRVFSADGIEFGKYFKENRTNAKYNELSPYLVKALVATEDERFYEHSGVDIRALGRVLKGLVKKDKSQGGGSTISQQLSKLLFPRKKMSKIELVQRKLQEWVIATRLERAYTKEEIIAMYFNKFDFLNNAVGINSAALVYFNKKPIELDLHEAAMLVGMAKNPSLFNPLKRPDTVMVRREVVLKQMVKANYLSETEYDSVRILPLGLNYTKVDHQTGLAPYFRESLRADVTQILAKKDALGNFVITKKDGSPYDIYADGLKIYTTIDSKMQAYAEWAVQEHLKYDLQKSFFENNAKWDNPPFSNDLSDAEIDTIMETAKRQSQLYKQLTGKVCISCERPSSYITTTANQHSCSHCNHVWPVHTKAEINKIFLTKKPMKVMDWQSPNFEKDTLFSPLDSIRYYKSLLRAAMVAMDPHTGHVKAWVGGANFQHFKYDMVKKGKRQVGSTFKPFVYATALEVGAISVCDQVPDIQHCVEVPYNKYRNQMWCPSNAGAKTTGALMPIPFALAASMNNITAYVISKDGMPKNVFNRVAELGIDTSRFQPVPSMALGVFDLSVYEMVGGMCSFVNEGVYVEPIYITRIEDKNGNIIYEPQQKVTPVWRPETAYTMLSILKLVTSGIKHPKLDMVAGTALRIRGKETESRPYAGIKTPIAGKTGTTQNQSDGWFMGMTPDLVAGVWVGGEDRSIRFRSLQLGMGTNMALPIYAYFMKKVYADSTLHISKGDFPRPAGIIDDPLNCKLFQYSSPGNINFDDKQGDGLNWKNQDGEW